MGRTGMGQFSTKWGWVLPAFPAAGLAGARSTAMPLLVCLGTLLVLGLLAAALFTRKRSARLVVEDIAGILHALDRISHGVFDAPKAPARTPEGAQLGTAVHALAAKIGAQVELLQNAAQRDPLTGMANRARFERVVERSLDQRREGEVCCLMFIDVDGFKNVNDSLGHNFGDRLLQCLAERLNIASRDELNQGCELSGVNACVKVARFGGDEFVIFMSGLAAETPARRVANRVLRVISEPFELSSHVTAVSASIGLAFVPGDASSYPDLLRAADTAMYHAKRSGRNQLACFTAELGAELDRQTTLERDLQHALAKGEFELHYQPLYDCRALEIRSAEALIRWRHPARGLVGPAEFIPLAEKSNLICDIGEWVVREAAKTIARFEQRGRPLRISVNISPQQIEQLEFVSLVKSSLMRSHATPGLLEIEVTESVAMRDPALAADRLGRLAELGVSIAIDDFGTGYSSLASLIRLPFSRLKIDRSLLDDLTTRAEARTLVQTIISMADGLGFHSVAEGVENAEQLALLCDMGCEVVQGYHLSMPVDEGALARLLLPGSGADDLYAPFTKMAC